MLGHRVKIVLSVLIATAAGLLSRRLAGGFSLVLATKAIIRYPFSRALRRLG